MYFTSKFFEWINSTYRHIGHLSCHWHLSHLEFKWLGDGCMPANTIWQFEGHIGGFQHRLQCRGLSLGSKSHQTKPYGFVKQLIESRVTVRPCQRLILWTVICSCFLSVISVNWEFVCDNQRIQLQSCCHLLYFVIMSRELLHPEAEAGGGWREEGRPGQAWPEETHRGQCQPSRIWFRR